ncbi:MAG TPA: TetR/AcrR family transcriptional regulator [Saprospiraceae bacterium]|nr:TetR/AcrR family transcriptional regulator [Saprospiraceae bacterium]HPN69152.1 TetR/AcrR family transcriptional regulator [Saprospiraceae bacterium]
MTLTSSYILEKVAPIFNKKGYVATSLSDITEATGLTKGAIYFNFKNKEDLAVQAFKKNIESMMPITTEIKSYDNAIDKLKIIGTIYGEYFLNVQSKGGCPILNVGIDAKYNNPELYQLAKSILNDLISGLERIVEKGKSKGQVKVEVDSRVFAQSMYALIEGGIFVSMVNEDKTYLDNALKSLNILIDNIKL